MTLLYKKIRDPIVRAWYHHQFLNAHRYKYGWVEVKTGRSRVGKTESNILDCLLLSKNGFDMRQVGWRPKDYVQIVEDAKTGSCVIWTEVGRGISARKWQNFQNILSGDIMQIMMIKKLIVKMDVIDLGFLDSNVRKMIRVYEELFRPPNDPTFARVFSISPNYRTGDIYYKHPIVKTSEGFFKLDKIFFKTRLEELDHKLYDEFAQIEKADKMNSLRKAARQMEGMDRPEAEGLTVFEIVNQIKTDGKEKYRKKSGSYDEQLIKLSLGIPKVRAMEVKSLLESEERSLAMAVEKAVKEKKVKV